MFLVFIYSETNAMAKSGCLTCGGLCMFRFPVLTELTAKKGIDIPTTNALHKG